jgi:hypothetical protein
MILANVSPARNLQLHQPLQYKFVVLGSALQTLAGMSAVQLRTPHERTIGSLASAGAGFNPEHVLYCIVLIHITNA